jgi:Domain of unknown function (DUF397)
MEDQIELSWRKASRSGNGGGSCVEVGTGLPGKVAIRDTKRREDGMHIVTREAFAALLADVKSGRFDLA